MNAFYAKLSGVVAALLSLAACDPTASKINVSEQRGDTQGMDCRPLPTEPNRATIPQPLHYRVVAKYPHDSNAFTQGLIYEDGYLYESTGLYGKSSVRKQQLGHPQTVEHIQLDAKYFGEGLTLYNNELIQLTWKSGKIFKYDVDSLQTISDTTISGEGWGLTHNGSQLIVSNGGAQLSLRDPQTFEETAQLNVSYAGRPLAKLNELEWVDGCLLANIWHNDHIAVIAPSDGVTRYTIDLSPLGRTEKQRNPEFVANGIAYRNDTGNLLVTGKNWQWLYEIEILPYRPVD